MLKIKKIVRACAWMIVFLAMYAGLHAQVWTLATTMGSSGVLVGNGIAADGVGNFFVTGYFTGTANFGSGITLNSTGQRDIFLAKFTPGGTVQWAVRGGAGLSDEGQEVAVDAMGDVYLTGYHTGPLQFVTSTGTTSTPGIGQRDIFVAKFDANTGKAVWLTGAGGGLDDEGTDVTVLGNNVYVAGYFDDTCGFGTFGTLSSHGSKDAFAACYNQTGNNWTWALEGGSPGDDEAWGICNDGANIYVAGHYDGLSFDFGSTNVVSQGGRDGFVTKLGSNGVATWTSYMGSPLYDETCSGISSDGMNVYVTGNTFGTANIEFYSMPTPITATAPGLLSDFWTAKFNASTGYCIWAEAEGGTGADFSRGIVNTGPMSVSIAGSFEGTIVLAGNFFTGVGSEVFMESFDPTTGSPASSVNGTGPGISEANDIAYDDNCGVLTTGQFSLTLGFTGWGNISAPSTLSGFNTRLSQSTFARPTNSPDSATICLGDSVTVTLTGAFNSVTWEFSTDNGITWSNLPGATQDSIRVSPNLPTLYRSFYLGNCVGGWDTTFIGQNAVTQPTVNGLPDTTCISNGTITFTVSPAAPLGFFGFPSAGFTDLGGGNVSFDPPFAGSGVHSLTYTWTDAFGCSAMVTDSIRVSAPIPLNITGLDPAYCGNDTVGHVITGGPTPSGTWMASSPCFTDLGNGTGLFYPRQAPTGMSTWISYSYYNGCFNQFVKGTQVDSFPDVVLSGLPASVCVNDSVLTLSANSVSANFFPSSTGFQDLGNGTATFDPNQFSPGSYVVYCADTLGGCTDLDSGRVMVHALPTVVVSGLDAVYCASDAPDSLVGNYLNGYVFSPNQPYLQDLGNGVAVFQPALAPTGAAIGLSYAYTASTGCSAVAVDTVMVHPNPVPALTDLASSYCVNDTLGILRGNYGVYGGFSSGPWLTSSGPGVALLDPSLVPAGSTILVVYAVTDSNGCAASDSGSAYVSGLPAAQAGADQRICPGASVVLGSSGVPGNSYRWYEDGFYLIDTVPQTTVSPSVTLEYTLSVTNGFGCAAWDTVVVTLGQSLTADAGQDVNLCSGDVATLGGNFAPDVMIAWSDSLGFASTASHPVVMPLFSQSYWLVVSDTSGFCRDSDVVVITVAQPVTADAGPDQDLGGHSTATLAGVAGPGVGTWSCSSGGVRISDVHSPTAELSDIPPGTWTLVWTVENAPCPAVADSMRIFVSELRLPSGFSPNGDGVNDVLVFRGLQSYPENRLQVFNRWGGVVCSIDHYQNDWGGTSADGQALVDDTYYYILELEDGKAVNSYLVIKR